MGAGLAAHSVFGANPTLVGAKKVKVGLVGWGGRGNGALHHFLAARKFLGIDAQRVATGHAFQVRAEATGTKFGRAAARYFGGSDAAQKVIATDCEFVLWVTPPLFRPAP